MKNGVQALVAFATAYGMPERIQAVGYHSCVLTNLVRGNLLDLEASTLPARLTEITMARWIIFDRCTDLLTPLMSQLTLEGRLDDLQDTATRTGWLPPERDAGADSQLLCSGSLLLFIFSLLVSCMHTMIARAAQLTCSASSTTLLPSRHHASHELLFPE
jgi:hypothetical protein